MAKKKAGLAGVTCLSLGRSLSMVECGLAYSANGVIEGKAGAVSLGLSTVFQAIGNVNRMLGGNKLTGEIMTKANLIERNMQLKKKIPASKSKQMLEDIRKMKSDVDLLFAAGASVCSGKK